MEPQYCLDVQITIRRGDNYTDRMTFTDSFPTKPLSLKDAALLMQTINDTLEKYRAER